MLDSHGKLSAVPIDTTHVIEGVACWCCPTIIPVSNLGFVVVHQYDDADAPPLDLIASAVLAVMYKFDPFNPGCNNEHVYFQEVDEC